MIDYNEYFKDISSYSEFKMKTSLLGKHVFDKEILDGLPKVDNNYRYIIENGSPIWINKEGLKEIDPKIETIEEEVFYNCKNLTSITIPNSVICINDYAFTNCTNLKSLKLPLSVINIKPYAFSYSGLKSITLPSSIINISEGLFYFCNNLTSVMIPDSVENIECFSFYCENLETVYLPKHLEKFKSRFPSTTDLIFL